MSTTEAVPTTQADGHGDPGTADGSPSGQDVAAQEAETKETGEGSEPEPEGGDRESLRAEMSRLREENEQLAAKANEAFSILGRIEQSPYGQKVANHLTGTSSDDDENDPVMKYVSENWPRTFVDNDGRQVKNPQHDTIVGLVKVMRQQIAEEVGAKVAPQLQSVQQTLAGSKFAESLSNKGIDPSVQRTPEFRAFVKQMEKDPENGVAFRKLRDARPAAAANWLAAEFGARGRVRTENTRQRERIEDAKGSRTNGASPRGGATATRQFVYDSRDPQNTEKLLEFYGGGGKREGVVRKK